MYGMKKTSLPLLFSGLLAVVLLAGPAASAADTKTTDAAAGAAETAKPKREWYPFYGTVAAVDTRAKTITLKKKEGERVIKVDSKSDLEIGGKPAILADVQVGNYAHGTLHKDSTGAEVILKAKFDKEPPVKGAATKEKAGVEKQPGILAPPTADLSSTNAPAKKKKKKAAAAGATTTTNTVPQ